MMAFCLTFGVCAFAALVAVFVFGGRFGPGQVRQAEDAMNALYGSWDRELGLLLASRGSSREDKRQLLRALWLRYSRLIERCRLPRGNQDGHARLAATRASLLGKMRLSFQDLRRMELAGENT